MIAAVWWGIRRARSAAGGITETVVGLEDVSKFPMLIAELARRGWSDKDLRKLAGENVLRAFRQAELVSARLKQQRPASIATIQQLDGAARSMP